jgi:NADP-dependent 3-hydroxy acid dehydrogenase YdfG
VVTIAIDVSQKEALKACVSQVIAELGTISTVISNAGTNRRKSAALASIDVWEEVINTNLGMLALLID